MKVTAGNVYNLINTLDKIAEAKNTSAKTNYVLSKFTSAIAKEFELINNERNRLVNQYGKKDEKGVVSVGKEEFPEFAKQFNSVLEVEIDVNIEPLNIMYLDGIELTTNDFVLLDKFIVNREN